MGHVYNIVRMDRTVLRLYVIKDKQAASSTIYVRSILSKRLLTPKQLMQDGHDGRGVPAHLLNPGLGGHGVAPHGKVLVLAKECCR